MATHERKRGLLMNAPEVATSDRGRARPRWSRVAALVFREVGFLDQHRLVLRLRVRTWRPVVHASLPRHRVGRVDLGRLHRRVEREECLRSGW